jgi:carboxymethylenebutenolidase
MRVDFEINGHSTVGYMAVPDSGSGPGVLVFQEWWGLVGHIERVCDRLAAAGFTALAPDMYHGRSTTDPDEAGRLMMALDVAQVAADARSALVFLAAHPACSSARVGVMGFCLGGQLALFSASENPDRVGACVDFYGVHPEIRPDVTRLGCPVLGFFAENDGFVTSEVVERLASDLRDAGRDFQFKTYPAVDHAFFNDSRPDVYDAAAAADAFERTVAFFELNLE